MEYNHLLQTAMRFNYIGNDKGKADAAVKATMGIIASSMSEEDAKEFANYLPEPLTLDVLRSHQFHNKKVSLEDYFQVVATQFEISTEEAESMVKEVLHTAKEGLSEGQFNSWKKRLPREMNSFMDQV